MDTPCHVMERIEVGTAMHSGICDVFALNLKGEGLQKQLIHP